MAGARWPGADPRPPDHPEPVWYPGSYQRGQPYQTVPGVDTRTRGMHGGNGRRRPPHRRRERWWGTRPGRAGVSLVAGCAAVGLIATLVAGTEPGTVLGAVIAVGTVAAALAVQPRAVHVMIPLPALAYLVAAAIAGLVHDRADAASRTALLTSAAQWYAGGFLATAAATAAAIVITAVRRPGASRGRRHRSP